jgi:FliI/YscN family ATPase
VIARAAGAVLRTSGETLLAALPGARIGDAVVLCGVRGYRVAGTVAAIEREGVAIVAGGPLAGIAAGDRVEAAGSLDASVGFAVLGRALDARGRALDGRPDPPRRACGTAVARVPHPAERHPIAEPLMTGVRAIDGLLTLGRGARVGIFGAPGAGKTTLLETVLAATDADARVLALVGERGREVRAWLERLDRRTTIVCATSDRSPGERVNAAELAMLQAQVLRAHGLHVALVIDSLARYAAALRERCVALGEPVGRGGYPPSVWAALARFLERAGTCENGSITVLATVLSDGADERDPLSDAARSLLDGHIVLSSALARAGHFPAIDVPASASRTMTAVATPPHLRAARSARAALALLAESRDARALGLASLDDPALARAVAAEPALLAFLRQDLPAAPDETLARLLEIAALVEAA